jgi:acyl carrier protein
MNAISDRLNILIADKLNISILDIKPESRFKEDLGADSLDTVEVIMEIEREFDIKIEDTEMESITIIQEVIDIISQKIKK